MHRIAKMLKKITFRVEAALIIKAQEKASKKNTTLNNEFRRWLNEYIKSDNRFTDYETLMKDLSYANPGRQFTRLEMNDG